jgi:biotin operon repressor
VTHARFEKVAPNASAYATLISNTRSGWKGYGNKLKSSMKLKRHLPKSPFPPTKPLRDNNYIVNHAGQVVHRGQSPLGNVKSIGQAVTEQSKRNSHAYQTARKAKRYAIIRQMAKEGASYAEMAEETGYTLESVRTAIKKMREAGEDIPELKRGPKCKK